MPKKVITTKQKTKLSVENFSTMTLAEQSEFIKITFDNYYKAQIAYMNNIVIKSIS